LEATSGKIADAQYHLVGCIICGKDIVYTDQAISRPCLICGKEFMTRVYCEDGHFVCDACHSSSKSDVKWFLRHTGEKDSIKILHHFFDIEKVHMHGPEHHSIVPGVLLTVYRNNGGDIDFENALEQAFERGSKVPGGFCGFWGVCGSAVGTGIYASIVLGGSPLKKETWHIPQIVTARSLEAFRWSSLLQARIASSHRSGGRMDKGMPRCSYADEFSPMPILCAEQGMPLR
jgi:hypothetical protein